VVRQVQARVSGVQVRVRVRPQVRVRVRVRVQVQVWALVQVDPAALVVPGSRTLARVGSHGSRARTPLR
jgi:hypothetical protein